MQQSPIKIAIIIVTWNNQQDIAGCLKSLSHQSYKNFKTVIVDNNSTDNTVEIVKSFNGVDLLIQQENQYFTGGNNIGIKYALEKYNPEFILILNPDTESDPNLLAELKSVLDTDKQAGAVGPKVKFWHKDKRNIINSAGLDYDGITRAYDWGFGEKDSKKFNEQKEVFGVSGTCILFRSEMLKQTGLFWNRLKMYQDEVELFIRAHKKGWKVIYTPKTNIYHKYMSSTSQNRNIKLEAHKMRNWLLIAIRHYSLKRKLIVLWKYATFRLGR